jgi:Xaa-Pro aminopeptidase
MSVAQRIERLRGRLRHEALDGLLVTNPENRRYLSGFTGHDDRADSAGTLLVGPHDVALITDGRYAEQAGKESPGVRAIVRLEALPPVAVEAARELGIRRLGFEAAHLTVALRDDLAAAAQEKGIPLELVATRRLVEEQRVVKDADELAAIERAAAITDETFEHLLGLLRPGLTEREVAEEIERFMRERGAEGCAFPAIVAGGPNAALPHAVPTERPLAAGETIIVDMGARVDGYCSDMTRTICLGRPPAGMRAMYADVLRAQQTCIEGLRPGLSGRQADALARDVLTAAGRGEQYLHGTGHGLGLEIHEDPRLGRIDDGPPLGPGMVLTVEPGAYVPGYGGVRIEDTVHLTADGPRVLTHSPRQLMVRLRRPRRAPAAPGVI